MIILSGAQFTSWPINASLSSKIEDEYTLYVWKNDGGVWNNYTVVSGGEKYLNGVRDDSINTLFLQISSGIFTISNCEVDEIFYIRSKMSPEMIKSFYDFQVSESKHLPFPKFEVGGWLLSGNRYDAIGYSNESEYRQSGKKHNDQNFSGEIVTLNRYPRYNLRPVIYLSGNKSKQLGPLSIQRDEAYQLNTVSQIGVPIGLNSLQAQSKEGFRLSGSYFIRYSQSTTTTQSTAFSSGGFFALDKTATNNQRFSVFGANSGGGYHAEFRTDAFGKVAIFATLYDAGGVNGWTISTGYVYQKSKIYHVAITKKATFASVNDFELYIDGTATGTKLFTPIAAFTGNALGAIGRSSGVSGTYQLNGYADEFFYYAKYLTPLDVKTIFNMQSRGLSLL